MRWGGGIWAALMALVFAGSADARPGDLDETFGRGGLVKLDVSTLETAAGGLAVGPDGRSYYLDDIISDPTLVALDSSGEIDRSFGADGRVPLGKLVIGQRMFTTPDGRVGIIGHSPFDGSGSVEERMVRFTPDGHLDATLDGDGILPIGDNVTEVGEPAFDGQGRMVVPLTTTYNDARLTRLHDDGSVDESFGTDGFVKVPGKMLGTQVLIANGSIYVVSTRIIVRVVKFSLSGELDTSFGVDGEAELDTENERVLRNGSVAVDSQGRLVYGGSTFSIPGPGEQFAAPGYELLRLTASGQPDPTFDAAPVLSAVSLEGGSLGLTGASLQDDRILLAGTYGDQGLLEGGARRDADPMLARLLPDGSLDPTFGDGGISVFPLDYSDFPMPELGALTPAGPGRVMSAGFGFLARFEIDDQVGNADADRAVDVKDACPRRYSRRKDGCQRFAVDLSINADRRLAFGRIKSARPCLVNAKGRPARVRVFATRAGKDERLGSARVDDAGHWRIKLSRGGGDIYASLPQHQSSDVGVCRRGASRPIELG